MRRAGLRVTRRLAEAEAEGRMESEAASAEGATGDQSADAQVQPKLRPQRAQPLAFESPVQHTHALPRRSLEAIGRAEQLTKVRDLL